MSKEPTNQYIRDYSNNISSQAVGLNLCELTQVCSVLVTLSLWVSHIFDLSEIYKFLDLCQFAV